MSEGRAGPHKFLRTAVLKTNPFWPFKHFNRLPYRIAVQAFVLAFRTRREVSSIYLRHGLKRGGWVPGLSDIDLTLILGKGLSEAQEYNLLPSFWKTFDRLKRVFPMLGEVEILREEDLAMWLSYTGSSPGPPRWTRLYGRENSDLDSAGSACWQRRALNLMLWIYLDLLPPCVVKPDSFLRRQDIRRRVEKILSHLRPILAEAGSPEVAIESSAGAEDLVAAATQTIERTVAIVDSDGTNDLPDPAWFPAAENRRKFEPASVPELEGVQSAILTRDRVLLVIDRNLNGPQIANLVERASRHWAGTETLPVLLPQNVFRYLLRRYNPYDYSSLSRSRTIVFGADPLDGVEPPGKAEFVAHTLDRLGDFLLFTRGQEVFAPWTPTSIPKLEIELDRGMALRLLLRTGWVSAHQDEIVVRWRHEFPDSARALEQIKHDFSEGREESARQAAFNLFRSVESEICGAVPVAERLVDN